MKTVTFVTLSELLAKCDVGSDLETRVVNGPLTYGEAGHTLVDKAVFRQHFFVPKKDVWVWKFLDETLPCSSTLKDDLKIKENI